MDDFLLRHSPGPTIAVAPALLAARQDVRAAATELRAVPDGLLGEPWPWRGEEAEDAEAEIRYGFYRIYELLEAAEGEVRRRVVAAATPPGPAVAPLAAATAARWELHGLLAGMPDELLDRDPGGGEWTVRQTLAHIVHTQRAHGWFTAWWHSRRDAPGDDFPLVVPDDVAAELPDEAGEAAGSVPDIEARLDDILDLSAGRLGAFDEADLGVRARWSGYPVTVGFRLGRWSSHMREHTVQVEKTLQMLGREPDEVDRLLRLVLTAYGRLEASAFLLPEAASDPEAVVQRAAREARSVAADVRGLAAARPAAPVASG